MRPILIPLIGGLDASGRLKLSFQGAAEIPLQQRFEVWRSGLSVEQAILAQIVLLTLEVLMIEPYHRPSICILVVYFSLSGQIQA